MDEEDIFSSLAFLSAAYTSARMDYAVTVRFFALQGRSAKSPTRIVVDVTVFLFCSKISGSKSYILSGSNFLIYHTFIDILRSLKSRVRRSVMLQVERKDARIISVRNIFTVHNSRVWSSSKRPQRNTYRARNERSNHKYRTDGCLSKGTFSEVAKNKQKSRTGNSGSISGTLFQLAGNCRHYYLSSSPQSRHRRDLYQRLYQRSFVSS